MRQIKFKGRRLDNCRWVYGSMAVVKDECFIGKAAVPINPVYKTTWTAVDKNTVCQFTGLCDKNGIEIYEGDIVNLHDSHETCGVIEYRDNIAAFVLCREKVNNRHKGDGTDYQLYAGRQERYEIVGNEYDNPEMLGYEKE